MTISRLVVPAFLFTLALVGCTTTVAGTPDPKKDTTQSAKPGETTEVTTEGVDVCAKVCARAVACEPDTDQDTCVAKCKNDSSVFLSKIRADYKTELGACIDGASCKDLDDGQAIASCRAETQALVSASPESTKFCEDFETTADKCGGGFDKASCFASAKVFSPAALGEATKCLAKKCADVNPCVEAALGDADAPGVTGGTTQPTPDAGTPTPDSGAPVCSAKLSYSTTTCRTCMTGSCCAEDNACASNSSCGTFLSCFAACTTSACESSCISAYPSGATAAANLARCMSNSCPASCGS